MVIHEQTSHSRYTLPHSLTSDSPESLVLSAARAGNPQAFETVVSRYTLPLFRVIRPYFSDAEQVWDILQEVWLKLYLSLPHLNLEQPLLPWLSVVARHCCITEIRKRTCRPMMVFPEDDEEEEEHNVLLLLPDGDDTPEEFALHRDMQQSIIQAIHALPHRYQAIVWLRYTTQNSFTDIAYRLHMPAATAKTYFRRALPLLREHLHHERDI